MSAKRPAVATAAHVVREAMTTNEGPTAVGAAAPRSLDELRWLSEAATVGPWTFDPGTAHRKSRVVKGDGLGTFVPGPVNRYRDAAFIVAAVNYVRAALASAQPTPGAARQPEEET